MPYTAQQILDMARVPLNDAAKTRYTDATLLGYLNAALLLLRKRRPDLFTGQWSALPGSLSLSTTWPTDDEYVPVVAEYVVARAELVDAEAPDAGRAGGFLTLFEKGLVTP